LSSNRATYHAANLTTNRFVSCEISLALEGERVDRVVALLGEISRSEAARLIAERAVLLDRVPVTSGSTRVALGNLIEVSIPVALDEYPKANAAVKIEVVHEDPQVIVVDKPADMVVHPTAQHRNQTLVNGLLALYPEIATVGQPERPGIVHRLDRMTSGLLMVARTNEAYHDLVAQLGTHEPERTYTALAWGHVTNDQASIDAPIGRSIRHPARMAVTDSGRQAVTHYQVEERFSKPAATTLLKCQLETGRTHQIRVHLRAIGHPLVGDRTYDGGRPQIALSRPFLHACELRFRHPQSKQQVTFESRLPSELTEILSLCLV